MILLTWIGRKVSQIGAEFAATRARTRGNVEKALRSQATIAIGLFVLTFLMFTKNIYNESFRSFYTFYAGVAKAEVCCVNESAHVTIL